MHSSLIPTDRKRLLIWLTACLGMVALMVLVGGLTRLTESGLSMVEWKPTTLLPPLSDAEWQEEFGKYQASPQFQKVNHQMNVVEFKGIFWLEYIHRLLGRLVGLVFGLPFIYFLLKRALPFPLALKLGGIFLLGGAQGFIGWYMVRSGLVDQPWVSPVRLMMHLGMAFLLFALLLWQTLRLWRPSAEKLSRYAIICVVAVYLQVLMGALVAGMDAGLLYDSFPTMNGEWVPNGIWLLEAWYRNLAENATAVHFLHRAGALILTIMVLGWSAILWRSAFKKSALILAFVLFWQVALGALTVIYGVPIWLASLHQVVALGLFGISVTALRTYRCP